MIALLPKYVLLNLLRDWLFVREIGKLDSACCSHGFRIFFLSMLADCPLEFSNNSLVFDSNETALISWLVARNVSVDSLYLEEKSSQKPSISKLIKRHEFKGLKVLKIECGPGYKSFNYLITKCPNLEKLIISNASSANTGTIIPMIKNCIALRHLELQNVSEFYSKGFQLLSKACAKLFRLTLLKSILPNDFFEVIHRLLQNNLIIMDIGNCRISNIPGRTLKSPIIVEFGHLITKLHFWPTSTTRKVNRKYYFKIYRHDSIEDWGNYHAILKEDSPLYHIHRFENLKCIMLHEYRDAFYWNVCESKRPFPNNKVPKLIILNSSHINPAVFGAFKMLKSLVIVNSTLMKQPTGTTTATTSNTKAIATTAATTTTASNINTTSDLFDVLSAVERIDLICVSMVIIEEWLTMFIKVIESRIALQQPHVNTTLNSTVVDTELSKLKCNTQFKIVVPLYEVNNMSESTKEKLNNLRIKFRILEGKLL